MGRPIARATKKTKAPEPCPSCGHCPTCGRGPVHVLPWWPYPIYPLVPITPTWTRTIIGIGTSANDYTTLTSSASLEGV